MRRMELWATLANTAFLSSLKREALSRAAPSAKTRRPGFVKLTVEVIGDVNYVFCTCLHNF